MFIIDPALVTTITLGGGRKKLTADAAELRLRPGRFPDICGINGQIFYHREVIKCDLTGDIQAVTYRALDGVIRALTIFND
jgi:hypothetical protein